MMKRLTDTEIWEKPWFMDLTPTEKLAFFYIKDNCDNVGVWTPNFRLAEFVIGSQLDWDKFAGKCNENIFIMDNGKWWLTDFCIFQHFDLVKNPDGGNSNALKSYVNRLKFHGLYNNFLDRIEDIDTDGFSREKITKAQRNFIYQRDGNICTYCGKELTNFDLVIDHILPVVKGGRSNNENLTISCRTCNSQKADMFIDDFIESKSLDREEIFSRLYWMPSRGPLGKGTGKGKGKGKGIGKGGDFFKKPTESEVKEYSESIGYYLTPSRFIDYYESTGWMIGKKKMKDWKAAVRTWKRRDDESRPADDIDAQVAKTNAAVDKLGRRE